MGKESILYLDDFKRGKMEETILTTAEDREYIQQLITLRDLRNNGMSRMEVIGLIQTLTRADFGTAENHWYYCRRKKRFPELKNNGQRRRNWRRQQKRRNRRLIRQWRRIRNGTS